MSRIDFAMRMDGAFPAPSSAVARTIRLWLSCGLVLADGLALLLGFSIGTMITPLAGSLGEQAGSMAAGMLVFAIVAFHNHAYDPACLTSRIISCRNALRSFVVTTLIFFLVIFALKATNDLSRLAITAGLGSAATLLLLHRYVIGRAIGFHVGSRLFAELVIVDDVPLPPNLEGAALVDAHHAGLKADLDDPYMLDRLGGLLRDYDRVLIACPADREVAWSQMLKGSNILGEIVVPGMGDIAPLTVGNWRGEPTLVVARGPLNLAERGAKRLLDIGMTVPVLVALLPLMLLVALAIKLDSPGPVLFRQQRIGRGNRLFTIFKFRTMRCELADADGNQSASRDDERVTRVGRLLRRTSIDELPQLINVLLGEMSLVGPRPHALGSMAEDALFWQVDRQYWRRHALKPGITGLAQIRGLRGATETKHDVLRRVEADLEYMQNWTFVGDVVILLRTFKVLLHDRAF